MSQSRNMSRFALVAGLGLALAAGSLAPALAETGLSDTPNPGEYANPTYSSQMSDSSTGETKLYIKGLQNDVTTSEGATDEQLKVSIPVAIHYVADEQGNLVGPTDNTVKFVNHTKLGAVHVSKIKVTNGDKASIVKNSEVNENDEMSFYMKPMLGQSDSTGTSFTPGSADEGQSIEYAKEGTLDELGSYVNKTGLPPTHKNEWNIPEKNGAIALNSLTGKIGGFSNISPATDYQAGSIHWTVRSGTRFAADKRDASVVIQYHPNTGTSKGDVPIDDQTVRLFDVKTMPEQVLIENAMDTALYDGTSVVEPPLATTDADGSVTTWQFAGWNTQADGNGTKVSKLSDLGKAEQLAGKSFEVFATFTSTKS